MKSRKTSAYAVALAAASSLVVGGCNGGDAPPTASSQPSSSVSVASPGSSASGSASTSPTPSASVSIPAAARAKTEAGAVAFVRHFFELINDGYRDPDGNSEAMIGIVSTNTCKSCSAVAADIASMANSHQKLVGPAFAPISRIEVERVSDGEYRVSFDMEQLKQDVIDAEGKVVDSQTAKKQRQVAGVLWKGGQWSMDGLAAA